MEYRIFNTIVNVDKPDISPTQAKFVRSMANFIELVLHSDEVFAAITVLKLTSIAEMIKDGLFKSERKENEF